MKALTPLGGMVRREYYEHAQQLNARRIGRLRASEGIASESMTMALPVKIEFFFLRSWVELPPLKNINRSSFRDLILSKRSRLCSHKMGHTIAMLHRLSYAVSAGVAEVSVATHSRRRPSRTPPDPPFFTPANLGECNRCDTMARSVGLKRRGSLFANDEDDIRRQRRKFVA